MEPRIIRCAFCFKNGLIRNLAEVLQSGNIVIPRRKTGYGMEKTIIISSNYVIMCGECGNINYDSQTRVFIPANGTINIAIGTN